MSVRLDIALSGLGPDELSALQDALRDPAGLHSRLATDAETFVKARGAETSKTEHKTATRLGATPTGHLADAYQAIESASTDVEAMLLVPRASRLRAAFGGYRVLPRTARFLPLPWIAEAYGRRAREFDDLEFSIEKVTFPDGGTAYCKVLVKQNTNPPVIMYLLSSKADIPEDRGLFPFDELAEEARDSAEAWLDETIERTLLS